MKAAARGYVCIARDDCRGRYASEGEWYPYRHESADGYDAVEWAAALPYANGKVGLYGASYLGLTQLLAAISSPPHLAAIMPVVAPSDFHAHLAYEGGAFEQLAAQAWSTLMAEGTLQREVSDDSQPYRWEMKYSPADYPLLAVPDVKLLGKYYFDWVAHPTNDDYWKQWSIEEHFARIRVPALHVGAWYDLFQEGSLRNYMGIQHRGGTEAARQNQRLVMEVGGHAGFGRKVGDVDFGSDSVLDIDDLALRWYDYILKGIDNGMAKEKPVRLFVMGKNEWRDEEIGRWHARKALAITCIPRGRPTP